MSARKHPIALNLPGVVPLLILYGRHVVQAMTDNAWFPSPSPDLPTVAAHLDELEAAEVTVLSGLKGAAAERDLRRKTVEHDLIGLKGYAYGIVGQNPGHELAIVQSAGMVLKRFTPRQKPMLAARMGHAPQEVVVRAKAVARVASYEWQCSADEGLTWIAMGTTTMADTRVAGLTVGATYLFRFRATIGKTTGDWSQTLRFLVH